MVIALCVSTRLDYFDHESYQPKKFSAFAFFFFKSNTSFIRQYVSQDIVQDLTSH